MPAQPSHAAAASSDDEDALPPSMHESLRDGLDSSDSSSSERRDNPRDERYDAVPLHEDSVEDGHANVKAVEESEKLLYQEKPSKHAGSEGKAKKQKHRQRKNSSSNVTGEKMKLKLEQSALRKRRRVSSAIAQARERVSIRNQKHVL